jgi:putative ABC transport system substrate-binding protein
LTDELADVVKAQSGIFITHAIGAQATGSEIPDDLLQKVLRYVDALEEIERGAGAVLLTAHVQLVPRTGQIISLAARYALPTMFSRSFEAREGGLLSYGTLVSEPFRLAGTYSGRILKGEKPADLPVQLATRFEFVINLKTARALRLEIPPLLLALADEVIE